MTLFSIGPLYIGTDPRYDLSIHLGKIVIQWDWSPTYYGSTKETTDRSESRTSVDVR